MKRRCANMLLLVSLLITAAALSACNNGDKPSGEPQPVIIEPGVKTEPSPEEEPAPEQSPLPEQPAEDFVDLGRASTLDDLMDNKAKIESYYFEQTISYGDGDIHVKTWYKGGVMKIVSSYPGAPESIDYYDCYTRELVTYTPSSSGKNAMLITYDEGDPELPDNPLDYNYHDYRVLETDSIDGQVCRVLESRDGVKLWVNTKYGFPMQVEFTDAQSEEHFVVPYENIVINQVTDEDVSMPADLVIYEMVGGAGF